MAEKNSLFYMVMEAEGDDTLQPFDAGDTSAEATPPPADNSNGSDDSSAPPAIEDSPNSDTLEFPSVEDDSGSDSNEDSSNNEDDNAEENKEDEQLSTKASNVLNKTLYDQFIKRNQEVEDIISNLQTIASVLPIEVVNENEKDVNRLKAALEAGKNYVIDKFVDTEYGGNMLYFRKLDALYTLLMDRINSNLKKAENSANNSK